jgi:hypothetical protein
MTAIINAEFIAIGYCGECAMAHVQLFDPNGQMVAQGVVDKGAAAEIVEELQRYIRDGVRKEGALNTMLFPVGEG